MTEINKYRLFCETEATTVTTWSETTPTVCPHNEAHTIDEGSIAVVETVQTTQVNVVNPDATMVNWPMTSGEGTERTPLFNPNVIPPGYLLYATGAFDNLSTGKRGMGDQMGLQVTDVGSGTLDGQFFEHVYILGGDFGVQGDGFGDWCSMMLWAPASTPEDRTATHDGNANKESVGGVYNLIKPAPGNDGDWNVDGATLTVGEINTGLVPVPDRSEHGYWNWDPDVTPSITPVANPAAPDGAYHLIDVPVVIGRQANRISLLCHEVPCCPDVVKGKKILPHWKLRFTLSRASTGTVSCAFVIKSARRTTANSSDLA